MDRSTYVVIQVKYPLFLSDFNEKKRTFSTDFGKVLKFHENPSSGSQVVVCRLTDKQTDESNSRFYQIFGRASKWIFKRQNGRTWPKSRTGQGKVACYRECGNEPSVSIK